MSAQKTYSIRCPKCGHPQQAELYDSINVAQQPELKAALFENRLNRVTCAACDFAFRVDKPLLYHDPDRRILIHWMPDTAASRDEILDEFDRGVEELGRSLPADVEAPRVRLVFNRPELIELIYLVEAGMDERVVEYIKYTLYTQNPRRLPAEEKRLLLNVQDSTAEELLFAVQNAQTFEIEEVLRYPRTAYRNVCGMFRRNPDEFIELLPGPYLSARSVLMDEALGEDD